jgi:hypothetical protein
MFGINIIEVAIGLVLAYLIFSSICSGLFELFASMTNLRAKHLEDGMKKMLYDPKGTLIVKHLYSHHMVGSEFDDVTDKLKHIGTSEFATAVLDILAPDNKAEGSVKIQEVKASLQTNKLGLDQKLVDKLNFIIEKAEGDITKVKTGLEHWFDHSMRGLSAWYRKRANFIITSFAMITVIGFNADTVRMAKVFWNDDELRQGIVNASEAFVANNTTNPVKYTVYNVKGSFQVVQPGETPDSGAVPVDTVNALKPAPLDSVLTQLDQSLNEASILPVGWDSEKVPCFKDAGFWQWLGYKFVGLMFTVGAVSLGAPYWFDMLKRLLGLRQAIKSSSTTTTTTSSTDTQPAK